MEYNLAGLRNRVIVDKLDDDEFDTNVVDNFLNDTQRDIFNQYELPFQESIFRGTIPVDSLIFGMPSDVALPLSYIITGPDGYQKNLHDSFHDFRTFNRLFPTPANNTPGIISNWTLFGGNILTSAPTDTEYTMTVFYIKKPTLLLEDGDVPELPEEFSELLILGALYRIQKRNEDYDQAAVTEGEYKNQLNLLVSRYGFRQADGPIKMKNQQIAR